ncbi:hypothetical protein A0O34_18095 [Chryseobacterium glaciei]|uniref:Uncharacterized protein n=2 Tax=Chryseobacterium glaciei TaxID=1685010 RepID=A0A172XZK6_9FLAO|nr:hypothetical protein A0O34_18095 [Chryseobacterium glaciei]
MIKFNKMEAVIISERKKSVVTDIILVTIFGLVPLFFFIKWLISSDDVAGSICISVLIIAILFFPIVVISGYIWDVKQKIVLSEAGIKLCYGRNIVDILHGEGSFRIFPDNEIHWNKITGFDISSEERREATEGGGYSTTIRYSLLIKIQNPKVVVYNAQEFKINYSTIRLGKFKEPPNEILGICERFQKSIQNENH